MITINTATASNTIIVTVKEKSVGDNPIYKLELFNFFTNETFLWENLTATFSNERKDIFEIPTISDLNNGQYKYTFYQVVGLTNSIVESGLAKVINSATYSTPVFLPITEEDDDFISL